MYTRLLAGASGQWRLSGPVASRPTVSTRMILYLRALPEMYRFTEGGYLLAETFLRRATDIDPIFSEAWAALADCICRLSNMRWWTDLDLATPRACDAVRRAISADPSNGIALATGAWALAIMAGEHEQALDYANQAVQFNPNSSLVHSRCGWALVHCDEQQRALESFDSALRLSPVDPEKYISVAGKGIALFFLRQFEEAADWARRAEQLRPEHPISLRLLAVALGSAGYLPEAQEAIRRLRVVSPNATMGAAIGNVKRLNCSRRVCGGQGSPNDHLPPRRDPCRRRGGLLVDDGEGRARTLRRLRAHRIIHRGGHA
jgi:adenylate cyclase